MSEPKIPCRYKPCVSFAKNSSTYGYCSIHDLVACDARTFDLALKGQISAAVRQFAEDVDRGLYPKGF